MSDQDPRGGVHDACARFRSLLRRHLEVALQTPPGAALQELSWHEHVLGCVSCRELLAAEEALEFFLATLPQPQLPPDLARRVVESLRSSADDGLDRLLELDELPEQSGLSVRVLAGLASARNEDALDRLLDRDRITVPPDLARRTLAALEPQRRRPALRLVRGGRLLAWTAAAAAVLLVAMLAGPWREEPGPSEGGVADAGAVEGLLEPDDDLLAALPVLEVWDLLEEHGDAVEIVTDPVYELLLDFDVSSLPDEQEPVTPEKPSKG